MIAFRGLVLGIFFAGAGCPHPSPPIVGPVDPPPTFVDAGAPEVPTALCSLTVAEQDDVTNHVVNACQGKTPTATLTVLTDKYGTPAVRCIMLDLLLDLREAPQLDACIGKWLDGHGGRP
jgi:hypothetical protein